MPFTSKNSQRQFGRITALVANAAGEIIDIPGYGAVGGDGSRVVPLSTENTIALPYGGELMYLPDRIPLVYNRRRQRCEALRWHPHFPDQKIYPVAAFNSPGYLLQYTAAYEEYPEAVTLPLFSYGAVGWREGTYYAAAILVDPEPRQDLRRMPQEKIQIGMRRLRRLLPENRLRAHLEKCALTYGCPAAKNFFLGRYEAPLPTSTACNARCLGCLSLQKSKDLCASQHRISFTPTAREIADLALAHIDKVPQAVVSFGQGCEGDPLMVADTIAEAILLIRRETDQGTIHMNTNASLPEALEPLFHAGLDSIRVSLNSFRESCYHAYFRPHNYQFSQVIKSISTALKHAVHVSINYLNCPGFTDTRQEADRLIEFLETYPINLIQWRNLNFDPLRYVNLMHQETHHDRPFGMDRLLRKVRQRFPRVAHGYFNPPKEIYLNRMN